MPGEITALLSALCYSSAYLCIRKGQAESRPLDAGLLPVLLVGAAILGLCWLIHTALHLATLEIPLSFPWVPLLYCAGSGVIGTMLGRLALYSAIGTLGATRGVILKTLAAFVTLLLAIALLGEQLDDYDWGGVGLLVLGIALLVSERWITRLRFLQPILRNRALLLGLAAALLQGCGHVMRKLSITHGFSALTAATCESMIALLAYLALFGGARRLSKVWNHYRTHWTGSLLAAGVMTAAGLLLFFVAINTAPVAMVSMTLATEPVLVAILSIIFLRHLERLTWVAGASAVAVTLGIVFINL